MSNLDVDKLLERILIGFKDYNPFVYKETIDLYAIPADYPHDFDWHISLNNKYCITLSGVIHKNEKGISIVTYEYNNKYTDSRCDLYLNYISIYEIDKNVTEENDTYPRDKSIYMLEQIKSTDGYIKLHNKYFNFDIIISELKEFINKST